MLRKVIPYTSKIILCVDRNHICSGNRPTETAIFANINKCVQLVYSVAQKQKNII